MATLDIIDLHASVQTPEGDKPILHGVNLHIGDNEIHAIMGLSLIHISEPTRLL